MKKTYNSAQWEWGPHGGGLGYSGIIVLMNNWYTIFYSASCHSVAIPSACGELKNRPIGRFFEFISIRNRKPYVVLIDVSFRYELLLLSSVYVLLLVFHNVDVLSFRDTVLLFAIYVLQHARPVQRCYLGPKL